MSKWVASPAYRAAVGLIAAERAARGLTQREVEERLGKGYHGFLAKIERGQRQMNLIEFIAISRALGASELELFKQIVALLPEHLDV